jgi:hypothetical protein
MQQHEQLVMTGADLAPARGQQALMIAGGVDELGEAKGGEISAFAFAQVETVRDLAKLLQADVKTAG